MFYFYENDNDGGWANIHTGPCGHCKHGQGKFLHAQGNAFGWSGPYTTYQEAYVAQRQRSHLGRDHLLGAYDLARCDGDDRRLGRVPDTAILAQPYRPTSA